MNSRFKNHLVLITSITACLGVAVISGANAGAADRLSIVSAYLCLFLLGGALFIGPLHVLRNGRSVANSYLRRDIGIWAALTGLLHFYLANVLSMTYEYLGIYVENAVVAPSAAIRSDLYTWGTLLGYVIAVLFVVLLMLSNDWMVRKVGMKWWKRIQRTGYLGFLFTCIHAFAFQVLESRELLWVFVVVLVTVLIISVQSMGIAVVRKQKLK